MVNLFKRGLAFGIDAILLSVIFYGNYQFVVASVGASNETVMDLYAMIVILLLQIIYVLIYFIYIPVRLQGQTIGKKVVKLKEVKENGQELTVRDYFKRDFMLKFLLISMTSGFVLVLNIILLTYQAIRKQELRALHDIIVKTKVSSVLK
ncbi:MAG: RDD family protein [Turicibacter sp.]